MSSELVTRQKLCISGASLPHRLCLQVLVAWNIAVQVTLAMMQAVPNKGGPVPY